VVDQDPPHQFCGHGEKVRAVLPLNALGVDKAHVRLVHQCGGLQTVSGTLASHAAPRDPMELVLDHRQQTPERLVIAIPPRVQKSGYVGW